MPEIIYWIKGFFNKSILKTLFQAEQKQEAH